MPEWAVIGRADARAVLETVLCPTPIRFGGSDLGTEDFMQYRVDECELALERTARGSWSSYLETSADLRHLALESCPYPIDSTLEIPCWYLISSERVLESASQQDVNHIPQLHKPGSLEPTVRVSGCRFSQTIIQIKVLPLLHNLQA
ncbi:hypothetical protein BGZ97_007829 [Linnemannia gamsii]|uniref:Uncharacterized protein n=1 Tax=Linnemannia gamsii TaxID=64522 RepID=A0A9P6UF14_9FUNG|nr:hypothetical protein BGZ97_007829 [Linnemannia gamsii]